MVRQMRSMLQHVSSPSDAVMFVRQSNAAAKMVDQLLKSYRTLELEQFELKQDAAEMHLRTQRKAGELLSHLDKDPCGRPPKSGSTADGVSRPVITLRQLGIDTHESHRWQRIASIPDRTFDEHISNCRSRRQELTTSSFLRLAERLIGEADEDLADGGDRPSGGQALQREYDLARRHSANMIWLDPVALATSLTPADRAGELHHLRRLRLWMREFEQALVRLTG
jgi:hypothetical protein